MAGKRGRNSKPSSDAKLQSVESAQREYGTRRSTRNKNNVTDTSTIISQRKAENGSKATSPPSRLSSKKSDSQSPTKKAETPSTSRKQKTAASPLSNHDSPSKSVSKPTPSSSKPSSGARFPDHRSPRQIITSETGKSPVKNKSAAENGSKAKSPASRLSPKKSNTPKSETPSTCRKQITASSPLRNRDSPSKSVKRPIASLKGNATRENDKGHSDRNKKHDKYSKLGNDSPKKNKDGVNLTKFDSKNTASKKDKVKKLKEMDSLSSHSKVNINTLDVSSLLALGENMKQNDETTNKSFSKEDLSDNSDFVDDSDSEDEWEEVSAENQNEMQNLENKLSHEEYTIPEEGVQITLTKDGVPKRKGKKGFDIEGYIRREMNRNTKELYVDLHKVSLLCLIARGRMLNNYLTLEANLAAGFSLLPTKQSCPPKYIDIGYLERFINWFRGAVKLNRQVLNTFTDEKSEDAESKFESELNFQLEKRQAKDMDTLVFMFILILRSCGVQVRLVWSLQPIPLKPSSDKLLRKPQETEENEESANIDNELPNSSKSTKKAKPTAKKETKNTKSSTNTKAGKLNPKGKDAKKSQDVQKKGRKMISSSEDEDDKPTDNKHNMWPEVYLEEEERWASVDLIDGKFMCDSSLEAKATKKICYIVSFDNKNNMKDVTRRYDSYWLSGTQKIRVSDWWNETLKPFRGPKNAKDKMEDRFLDEHLLSQPFPKSIQEFKGHPLYSLRRHLLKFEAIYPPAPPPLGFIKNEPVYARECVKTLHSRELWLKQAKVVRMGEDPYKIVKSRPKYDRASGQLLASLPLDLFGEWQVEDYVPPTAENGIVPRNEYGNVELFLDKMLPKGTVHLRLSGLNRVAKKLGIDCASALTGFEFHCGGSHPTYDGFVVCEEFEDVLVDAWNEEQREQEKKDKEKRLKRIYDNWTKLLKGLLIREKLNRKYAFNLGGKRKNAETDGDADNGDEAEPKAGPSQKRRKH